MTYEAIEADGGIQWPYPAGATEPPTTRRLYDDGQFQTDDGKAQLIPIEWEPFPEQPTRGVSVRAQHRPDGGALAHPHQDRARCRFWSGCRRAPGSR